MNELASRIARDLDLPLAAVAAVLALLDEGATVPFIARYRKERTGLLDEVAIRAIADRRDMLSDLDKRRATILASIREQGQLTAALEQALMACTTKAALEDLYLPFKKKRKTKASVARERGLEPLALKILAQPRSFDLGREARPYVSAKNELPDEAAVWDGARDIVAELVSDRADVRAHVRAIFGKHARVATSAIKKATEGKRTAYEDYYDFREPGTRIPSHRYLAIARGEDEGVLRVKLEIDDDKIVGDVHRMVGVDRRSPAAGALEQATREGYERLLRPSIENETRAELKARAEREAATVFAKNLESILLAPPLGERAVLAIDPGFRTGCKVVALSAQGELLMHKTVFPHGSAAERARAAAELQAIARRHPADTIAVGSGTGGRETEAFVREAVPDTTVVSVSEAGASVYSASDIARAEFPDLDLTYRGAVSIGRRLQDPLAELVKIDPKALGVGQYQHDIPEKLLRERVDVVVETAVNRVGVDVNTASPSLLEHVAGIGPTLAKNIVAHRQQHGAFTGRSALRKVSGLGPQRFEQAAGFLRIRRGEHPLDASAVHPERYALVERMARDVGSSTDKIVGDAPAIAKIDIRRYFGDDLGEPTLRDIVAELARPGRDPRAAFEAPRFRDDVNGVADLEVGMELEGVVTNVTPFGAFVDIGVHQDGLVHVSELADRFVEDPHEVVHPGQRVTVRVLSVDHERKRIALSRKGTRT